MLAANNNNEFLYSKHLLNVNLESPYIELETALDSIGIRKKHCIDNIYILDTGVVLVGNSFASSLIKNNLLTLRNKDNFLKDTGNYSVFSRLRVPFVLHKKFHVKYKDNALNFFNSLLDVGTVTMLPSNKSISDTTRNINNQEQFEEAWESLQKKHHHISLLNRPSGDVFKIFVCSGKVIGVYGIVPPFIIGDGVSSVGALVLQIKTQRNKNILYKSYGLEELESSLDFNYIPIKGEVIKLKDTYEIENGAVFINVTDSLRASFDELAYELRRLLGDNLLLEITAFSENIEQGFFDKSFMITEIKLSNIDIRMILSVLSDRENFDLFLKKILFNKEKVEEYTNVGFIEPEIYDNSHFLSGNVEYIVKEAAYQLGLKVNQLDSLYWEIKDEVTNKTVLFLYGMSEYTTTLARRISNDKYKTKRILQNWGLNTPEGNLFNIRSKDLAWESFGRQIIESSNRIVVKPLDGQRAQGVTTDISSYNDFNKAWALCKELGCKNIIVEEQLIGDEYRIIVIQNKVCAVSQRVAAHVIGDGRHTIRELVSLKNINRHKNVFLRKYPIKITKQTIDFLFKRNLNLDYVPFIGEKIKLSEIVNASAGGDIIDRTSDFHPDWITIAVHARRAIANAYHVGLDIIITDITKSPNDQKWAIIEVNTNPGFGIQLFPTEGKSRNIGKIYLESIFGKIDKYKVCYKLLILGKVQGVGFRKWFKNICDTYSVVGYVKNNQNKQRLDAVIVGAKSALDEVLKLSYIGPKFAEIRSVVWEEIITDIDYKELVIS